MIFPKICLNLSVRASAFFFNRLCPFCAPFSLTFIWLRALETCFKVLHAQPATLKTYILEGKTLILSFPDIPSRQQLKFWRGMEGAVEQN